MKKIIILLITALMISSCGAQKLLERSVTVGFADYRIYADAGFFISPNAYALDYTPIGELYIEVIPGQEYRETRPDYFGSTSYFIGQEDIAYQDLIEMAVKEALDRDADGISNFKITKTTISQESGLYKYDISGFCIKRK